MPQSPRLLRNDRASVSFIYWPLQGLGARDDGCLMAQGRNEGRQRKVVVIASPEPLRGICTKGPNVHFSPKNEVFLRRRNDAVIFIISNHD